MCGLAGVVGDSDRFAPRFHYALDSIAHRGPDGEGIERRSQMLLGHRRLAIIDLSPGGYQPMVDSASDAVIVFNGEIYNYIELRAQLAAEGVHCRGSSDTEVLLKAFLHWREAAFAKLNGMWALAIWEPQRGTVTLSRDRFGVKPLYWHVTGGTLIFGSEPKALIALDPRLAEPDPAAIYDLVVNSRSFAGERSFYRNIRCLPPAHWAVFRPGEATLKAQRFWQFPRPEGQPPTPEAATSAFAELFDDAVRLRLRSDVPVGLTLSGGLDSSAVLAGAQKQHDAPMRCFTSVYGGSDRAEESWARIASTAWGAELETVEANDKDWLETVTSIVHHMDGPGFSPAVFPLWAIMRRARAAGVPVLLEGQGADELMAGYPQYLGIELGARLNDALSGKGSLSDVRDCYRSAAASVGGRTVLLWALRRQFPAMDRAFGPRRARARMFVDDSLAESARADNSLGLPPLLAALHADHSEMVLPPLLQYGDAISMAHGIETRLPFMDYRLVEWVYRTNPPLITAGRTKMPVRHYLAANRLRAIADRADKLGYPTMVRRWLGAGVGKGFVDDLIATPGAELWSLVDRQAVVALVDKSRAGDAIALFHLYKLVVTQIWLQQAKQPRASVTRNATPLPRNYAA
jgi:asparagine synthase (glutamine-hydrolysing)